MVLENLPTLVSASRRGKGGDVPDKLVTAQTSLFQVWFD